MASDCAGEAQIGYQEEFIHGEGGQALEQADHRSGRVPIPGGIQKMSGRGVQGNGLALLTCSVRCVSEMNL